MAGRAIRNGLSTILASKCMDAPMFFSTQKQPPPVPNNEPAIADYVIKDLAELEFHSISLVPEITARRHFGEQSYGVALQAHNGRDAAVDAFQEVLDLVVYLKQECLETGQDNEYWQAVAIANSIHKRLASRKTVV